MNDFKIFNSVSQFITSRSKLSQDLKVGFVPTMGALHEGHASLIKKSAASNEITVISIFVNPTQFNSEEDFKKYPKSLEADFEVARQAGANWVLAPNFEDIYNDNYRFKVQELEFSKRLCGQFRPGHFDGVLTVVNKLLHIVRPNQAFFGEKDYQQLQLIKDMVSALFMEVEIVPCETQRESDGLAMSSRNARLSSEGRKKAALIYQALRNFNSFAEAEAFLAKHEINLEYLEEYSTRRYIAAYVEGVRLIDNVKI